MSGWVDILIATLILATAAVITFWISGAFYFDVCRVGKWAVIAVVVWVFAVVVLFEAWQPLLHPFAVLLALMALFLGWWFQQKPSHDHEWHPSVALLPRARPLAEAT